MMDVLGIILVAALGILMIPLCVLLVQVIVAVIPRQAPPPATGLRPRLAVLIPAHNESLGIGATLLSIKGQLVPGDRIVVVADNCTDDTAAVAAQGGAEVAERHNENLRGKGYALDFGIRHLEKDPPDMVVIVDADCDVQTGTIDSIARLSASAGRPVQARYLMKSPPGSGAFIAVSEFAWLLRNLVRPLGFQRLGLPCQMMGSGMAVGWESIRLIPLASGHIAEDMQMGIDLARAGTPPLFCPDTLVSSYFPCNSEGIRSQRTRWEHGHISMILGEVPKMIADGMTGRGAGLLPLALDICVPPLALMALIILVLVGMAGTFAVITAELLPLLLALLALLVFSVAIGISWLGFGTRIISLKGLILAVSYAIRKLPLYFRFLVQRQVKWVRSKRDGE